MFTAIAAATAILAGSVTMPIDNPWSVNDWAPLRAEYANCSETATSYFSYIVCATGAYNKAITITVKA